MFAVVFGLLAAGGRNCSRIDSRRNIQPTMASVARSGDPYCLYSRIPFSSRMACDEGRPRSVESEPHRPSAMTSSPEAPKPEESASPLQAQQAGERQQAAERLEDELREMVIEITLSNEVA